MTNFHLELQVLQRSGRVDLMDERVCNFFRMPLFHAINIAGREGHHRFGDFMLSRISITYRCDVSEMFPRLLVTFLVLIKHYQEFLLTDILRY